MTHGNTGRKFVVVFVASLTIWILIPAPGSTSVLHNRGTVVDAGGSSSAQNAQTASARFISGTVLDPSGGSIAGARVILASEDGKEIAQTSTDGDGNFNFEKISDGSYTIYAQAACFNENRMVIKLGAKALSQVRLVLQARPVPLSASQTRIRLGTLLPQGSSQYRFLEKMGQNWRCATNGSVTLTIYGGGTMGGEQEMIRRMRAGQLQAATISAAGLSDVDPAVGAVEKIPMLYHSLDEMHYVLSKLQPELEQRMEQKGFVVLCWADAGWIHIFSRQPYTRPEEFQSKRSKVFVTATDGKEVELINNLGFQAVPLEWPDVLISLQTGLLDTVPSTPFYALASQFDLAAKNMLLVNYVPLVGATVMTKKAWDSLTQDQREKVIKAAAEAGKQIQAKSRAESEEAIEAMKKKRGLQVHPVPSELEDDWRHFAEAVYPKMRGTMIPADVFDRTVSIVAEYRASQKSGHR